MRSPEVNARAAIVMNAKTGKILYTKNPYLRLPPASTTKVMTAILVLEKLKMDQPILVSQNACNVSPSKANLTVGATYRMKELLVATLVASSNDAAVALAEAVAGSEAEFTKLMNAKAKKLGMKDTYFVNATGLPDKKGLQQTTVQNLGLLMRHAARDKRIDEIMGITFAEFRGSDGKTLSIRSHNKMLWRMPKFVKGKTGWTSASQHTFVGMDYDKQKEIVFAMLHSRKPWNDIEKLATFGFSLTNPAARSGR